jgi:multicomponent Na+:H+ antiporter subunit D
MTPEFAVGLSLLLPLIGMCGVLAIGERNPNAREGVTMVTTLVTLAVVLRILPAVLAGERPGIEVLEVLPGLTLAFEVEPLGMVYALVASGLWIVTSLYAIGYLRGHHEVNQTRFFACFAAAISAALGIAYARNLFTLFVFYEALTFSTYPLVTHAGTEKAKQAGRIYLGILVTTSVVFLLFGIIWTQKLAGTLEFTPGGILAGKVDGWQLILLVGLFAFGTGKAALMPFHRWLPAAMVAPTPVSALLHDVAVVKAGVFTVLKVVVYIFGIDLLAETGASQWLMAVAGFTILASSVIALTKDNLKARLAYSTISQLSYIVLGAAMATTAGVIGGGMHIAMHAVGKITLFFCAGAIMVGAHKTDISTMDGLGRRMPWTMGAFFLGSLSIIGLPPFGGSWSKWYLLMGAVDSDQYIYMAILMISSLLSIGYLMPVVARAFFLPEKPDPDGHHHDHGEAPFLCVMPPVVTAVGCVLLFVFAEDLHNLLTPIVAVSGG